MMTRPLPVAPWRTNCGWAVRLLHIVGLSLVQLSQVYNADVLGSYQGRRVSMLSSGQVEVFHAGQSVYLQCEFHMEAFRLFDHPVLWKKVQRGEATTVNILGNILPPFAETRRFSVSFLSQPPRYKLALSIKDLTPEDYGNYTCEIRAPQTEIIADLTHFIFVTSPVRSITLSDNNRSVSDMDVSRSLSYTENVPSTLHCISYGGCPPPEMSVYLGQRDITSQFSMYHSAKLSGQKGLRLIEHQTDRWTDRFTVTAADDGERLQCIVTVPGLGSNISTVKLRVFYAPVIKCDPTQAFLGDRNVYIRCEIMSRPSVNAQFWIIDGNGTTVSNGEVVNEVWTLVRDRNNGVMETRLYLKEAKPASFKSYTIIAENNIGTTTHHTELLQRFHVSSQKSEMQVLDHHDRNHDGYHVAEASSAAMSHVAAPCPHALWPLTLALWPLTLALHPWTLVTGELPIG